MKVVIDGSIMKKVYLLAFVAAIFSGCEQDEIEIIKEVEKQYTWQGYVGFEQEYAIQMNSFATESNFYSLGPNTFSSMLPNGVTDQFGFSYHHHFLFDELSTRYKFPIAADFFITYTEKEPTQIRLGANKNPNTYTSGRPAALTLSLPEIDETFNRFQFVNYSNGPSFAINNRDQALVVYSSTESSINQVKALLLDVTTYENSNTVFVDTVKTKVISYPGAHSAMVALQAVEENFFFSPYYSETYRITPNGDQVKVLDNCLMDIFEHNQVLYGISYDGLGYVSVDEGLTWQKRFELQPNFQDISFAKIDGKIIGFAFSQIFEIFPSLSTIEVKELDNYGLAGKKITSAVEFNGKVYLTTLSGVYYKDLKDLSVEKEVAN